MNRFLKKKIKHIYYERILSNKLDYTKLGLYRVKRVLRLINYKLNLLKKIRIYLSFYISVLELANFETLV